MGPAHRPAYLSPVAEHLSVSSVGHELLGELEKTWCHLRRWPGKGGPHPALGSTGKVAGGPLRNSGGGQRRCPRGEAQREQPLQDHGSFCDWAEGRAGAGVALGTPPGVNVRGPSVIRCFS